ncbi:MAG TPA: hypothetical protein VMT52_14265 [Planctomycetota bacterium]|nr:hypothetical protein [Planctomycetota bacterium]
MSGARERVEENAAPAAPGPAAALVLGALWLACGCASPAYEEADAHYYQNDPDSVTAAYREAILDNGKNALLGIEKLLSAALLRHDWSSAEALAVRASTLVNIFVADEGGEQDALSFLGREKDKPFKGEPHERVMVDFYLGMLRLRNGDPEGALAAFRSAMQKDRGSFLLPVDESQAREGEENAERYIYDEDLALLNILAAKCCQLLEEPADAEKYRKKASAILPSMVPLFDQAMDPDTNVLLIVEAGEAPRKRQSGPQGAVLAYEEGWQAELEGISLGGEELSFGLCEELHYQATTLGGREVDKLNIAKAEKQEALQIAGFATIAAGYMLASAASSSGGYRGNRKERRTQRDLEVAGLITIGVGIGAMIFAATAIDPSADVRAWTMLPGTIYLAVGRVAPGAGHRLRVRARGGGSLSQEWTDVPVEQGVNIYWIRLLPGRRGGPWIPPPREIPPGP